jgi:beta-N-acetylglucosaminidase
MRKVLLTLISCLLITIAILPIADFSTAKVHAACNAYQVARIKDNGEFEEVGCYSSLSDAKNKMRENNDYVIRNNNSYSPTKIIAMNSGIVYSYPGRSGSATLTIYQHPNKGLNVYDSKRTYVDKHREMFYYDLYNYDVNSGNGEVYVNCLDFKGYVSLKDVDLVPTKFLEKNLAITLGGRDSLNGESAFTFYPKQNYYKVVRNGNYLDLVYYFQYGWSNSYTTPRSYTYIIGKAADFMNEGEIYYSFNGYDFYRDGKCSILAGTYFNYYQYLPLRAESSISASTFNQLLTYKGYDSSSKLWNTGQYFLDAEKKYGINAALLFGIACNESGYGTSGYARTRNNLFGWNAIDSNPDNASYFSSVQVCIDEMASYYMQSYIDLKDWRFFGSHVGNKGSGINVQYAADPNWGMKAAMNAYLLDKLQAGNNGNYVDLNRYTIANINKFNIDFKKEPSDDSYTYKTSYFGPTYQGVFTVILLDQQINGYQKVVSTNPITADRNTMLMYRQITNGTRYNRASSYFWIKDAYLNVLNRTLYQPSGDFVHELGSISFTDNKLKVTGKAYVPGILIDNSNDVSVKLIVYSNDSVYKSIDASLSIDQDQISFEALADLDLFVDGRYTFKIALEYKYPYSIHNNEFEVNTSDYPERLVIGNTNYGFIESNGKMTMVVKSSDVNNILIRKSLEDLKINEDNLDLSGFAFFDAYNFDVLDNIHYQLIIESQQNSDLRFTYDLTTAEREINMFDGYIYKYIKYLNDAGTIDLNALPIGDYIFRIKISNGDLSRSFVLSSIDEQYANIQGTLSGGNNYRLATQELYDYRFELTISKESIDYSLINKPSRRTSTISFYGLDFDETTPKMLFDTLSGYIRFTSYDQDVVAGYRLLITNIYDGSSYEYPFTNQQCLIDFDSIHDSQYKMNYGCIDTGEGVDVSQLPVGIYRLSLILSNGDYYDIQQMSHYIEDIATASYDGKQYHLFTDIYQKIYLEIKEEE